MKIISRYEKNEGRHQIIRVSSGVNEYSITSAEPFPNDEEVKKLWKNDKKNFRPWKGTLFLS